MFRIGFGYDAHRFVQGRALIMGGLDIPSTRGLEGHSDADVLTHAIMDGILGALSEGDIGIHFPDSDPAYKDIESLVLLQRVVELMKNRGYRINNLDNTIVAEEPRFAPHIPAMKANLCSVLAVDSNRINIKATTSEGMGFCGRGEGIAAYSIVSLIRENEVEIQEI